MGKEQYLGGKKALIVTDAGLVKLGFAERIQKIVEEAGIEAVVFGGAGPNPTDKNVEDGFKVWQEEKCDALISLGGGLLMIVRKE